MILRLAQKMLCSRLNLIFLLLLPLTNLAFANQEKGPLDAMPTQLAKLSAHISIFSAELVASAAAEKELKKFRLGGKAHLPVVFEDGSAESLELLAGDYYQDLTEHLVEELARWYAYQIPSNDGLFLQTNTFRVFGLQDTLVQIVDGVDLADVIGTITYYVRMHTLQGRIYFRGINKMSLESYSGANYFQHQLIDNPTDGAFEATTQVFEWSVEIPEKYRQ